MKLTEVLHFQVTVFPLTVVIILALMDFIRLFKNDRREWTTTNKVLSLASALFILLTLHPAKLLHQGIFMGDATKVKAFIKYHYLIFVPSSVLYLYKEHVYQLIEQPPYHFKPYGILPRFCWYIINENCALCAPVAFRVAAGFRDNNPGNVPVSGNDAYLKWHGLSLKKLLYFQMILVFLYSPLEILRFYRFLNYGPDASTFRNHSGYIVVNVGYILILCSIRIGFPFYYYGIKHERATAVKYYFIHKTLVLIFGGGFFVLVCEFEEDISLIYEGFTQKLAVIFYGLWASVEMSQIMQLLIYISKKNNWSDLQRNIPIPSSESSLGYNCEDALDKSSEISISVLKFSKAYRILPSKIKTEMVPRNFLGKGQYGRVWKGMLTIGKSTKRNIPIAMKVLNVRSDRQFEKSIMEEIKVLNTTKSHPNLVKFYGVCSSHRWQLAIVLELCENGNLKSWFEKQDLKVMNSNTLMQFLYQWSTDIAVGMEYLGSKKIIHGDLALRNILLNGEMTAKISDFGMSIRLYNYQHYAISSMQVFPWKWMAPESLKDLKFSTESDIWSFGVLLWEMFSLGQTPWSGLSWNSNFANLLIDGLRLSKPELATEEIYKVFMTRCWQIDKTDRIPFKEIATIFRAYCSQNMYTNLENSIMIRPDGVL